MLSYVLVGLSLGAIYAIAAGSLVITYVASGIFNLSFAAMAYTVARCYYFLNTEQGWGILASAVVSLGVFAPLLGIVLYAVLFRHLRLRSTPVKLVATIGLSVALPPLVNLIFGTLTNPTAPGLAPRPLGVITVFDTAVNGDQIATYLGLVVVLVAGIGLLRFTSVGLKVRALVDSEAMTALNGISPGRVSVGVWAASSVLAGLAGILVAPTAGLSAEAMTGLMATAFAAVVAARLRHLGVAIGVALMIGVVTGVVQKFVNADSDVAAKLVPGVPFVLVLLFLIYHAFRGQAGDLVSGGGLDPSISTQADENSTTTRDLTAVPVWRQPGVIAAAVVFVVVAIAPLGLDEYWTARVTAGICLAIAMLSYTLLVGEGGMVWLSQITFAGLGAIIAAELATDHGLPALLAIVVAALLVTPVGVLIGILTIRLGDLYVALVTLSFGLLVTTLVFTTDSIANYGMGVALLRPDVVSDSTSFAYLALVVFAVTAILVANLRRSTTGLAISAVRWSENGARTIGLSIATVKILLTAPATFVAAVGGGFLAMNFGSTLPDSFSPFHGLVWLAVLVTVGSRSIVAALVAGALFYLMPAVFDNYLPSDLAEVPTILFGLGAIMVARNPEGVIAQFGDAATGVVERLRRSAPPPDAADPDSSPNQEIGGTSA